MRIPRRRYTHPVGLKAEHTEATRKALVKAARALFERRGYAATPTEDIVKKAGVTRGALYHHFRGKEDLFRAVYEEVEAEVAQRVTESMAGVSDPAKALDTGLVLFLDVCLEPRARQIGLIDGPSVLGWEAWREIGSKYAFGLLKLVLEGAMEAGYLKKQPVDPLAHILLGALGEAAMVIANAPDPEAARVEMGASLRSMLEALRA